MAVMSPKKLGRAFVCYVLEKQVKQLRKKNNFKLVAVAGSVGKTSTKLAVARTLEKSLRVQYQEGNYNDRVTVPLVLFGENEPNILNPFAWWGIFRRNAKKLKQPYPYDVAVVELGPDGPGQMKYFSYLKPDLSIVTAVAPEHMEFFGDLATVAKEELSVVGYSKETLLNVDDISKGYLPIVPYSSYGANAEYSITAHTPNGLAGQHISVHLPDVQTLEADIVLLGEQGAKVVLAAVAVAHKLGLTLGQIKTGVVSLTPFAGRMQVLDGIKKSKLIDDTYNASPLAMKAALDVLYSVEAPQRVAILGSMNEMGEESHEMHKEIGEYCDPGKLALVVTVGKEAGEFLAPAALAKGCLVKTFVSPYDAGEFVKSELKESAVVLGKGSQNGVFAEEALKQLLAKPEDSNKLVRQSAHWLQVKKRSFL